MNDGKGYLELQKRKMEYIYPKNKNKREATKTPRITQAGKNEAKAKKTTTITKTQKLDKRYRQDGENR